MAFRATPLISVSTPLATATPGSSPARRQAQPSHQVSPVMPFYSSKVARLEARIEGICLCCMTSIRSAHPTMLLPFLSLTTGPLCVVVERRFRCDTTDLPQISWQAWAQSPMHWSSRCPFFRVPEMDEVIFHTGDDTTMINYSFCHSITRFQVVYYTCIFHLL